MGADPLIAVEAGSLAPNSARVGCVEELLVGDPFELEKHGGVPQHDPPLVLETDLSDLVESANGADGLADAFGDLLVEPRSLSARVAAWSLPGLDLDRRCPPPDHDEGVSELATRGASPMESGTEDKIP